MNSVFSIFSVILVIAASVSAVPVSDELDQVPQVSSAAVGVVAGKDDGSSDLKPPPPPTDNEGQYSSNSAPSSETSVYDPSIYSVIIPNGIPGYPDPFPAGYPQPYPGYPHQPPPGYPTPYAVQTGYEGYLMPAGPSAQSIQTAAPISESLSFLEGIFPGAMLNWIARSMAVVMGTVTMVIMGGALTTALCSLTPICSVSFKSLKFFNWNETARNVGTIVGNEMTPERVRRAANFVHEAIRKYSELQKAFASVDDTVQK